MVDRYQLRKVQSANRGAAWFLVGVRSGTSGQIMRAWKGAGVLVEVGVRVGTGVSVGVGVEVGAGVLVNVGVGLGPGVTVGIGVGGTIGSSSLNKTCSTFNETCRLRPAEIDSCKLTISCQYKDRLV